MKKIFTILMLSVLFAGELEVEGDLRVTGNIQAGVIDSLQQVIAGLQAQITAMQNSGGFETRLFTPDDIEFDSNGLSFDLDLQSLTGYDLDAAVFQLFKINEYEQISCSPCGYNTGIEIDYHTLISHNNSTWNTMTISSAWLGSAPNIGNNNSPTVIQLQNVGHSNDHDDSFIRLNIMPSYNSGTVSLTFAVTADFSNAPTYQAPVPPQNSRSAQ